MQLSARALAEILGGEVVGDPNRVVSRPSRIEEGGEGTISFLGNDKYEPYVYSTDASVVLVSRDFSPRQEVQPTLIRVDDVYQSLALLLEKFGHQAPSSYSIADTAVIHPDATLADDVSVGAQAVIEAGARIGSETIISPHVYVGADVRIGNRVFLHPGVRILRDCEIGDGCIVHANSVIGSDGFGFAPTADGSYRKIAHVGRVILEADVEIGANTTIDRATMGATILRRGVKLDNLVQVGHNVEIGEHTVVAAQTGIAGSTKIGSRCRIGGQVGFAGHTRIADGTQIQAQSGIAASITKNNTAWFGSPAIPYRDYIRSYAVFKKLPELYRSFGRLEKQIRNLSHHDNMDEGKKERD